MELNSITFPGLPDPYKVAPASHLEDKNNPHGVTPEQIGAAPASHLDDMNNPHGVTPEQIGAHPNTWMPTAAQVGAAPTGYGLGGKGDWVSDIDVLTDTGFYAVSGSAVGNPDAGWGGLLEVYASLVIVRQVFSLQQHMNCKVERTMNMLGSGTWSAWEWENPPMALGVEYRTTERWNGKAVYTKLIDLGALPNNTEKNVTHGIANLENALSISAFAKSSDWQFTLPSSYAAETKIVFAPQAVTITTTVDRSAYNAYATLKYTKSV